MATASHRLDAHQKPPEELKALFKKYQKATKEDIETDPDVIDLTDALSETPGAKLQYLNVISSAERLHAWELLSDKTEPTDLRNAIVYQVRALPGLLLIPSLLSSALQIEILNRLLHRDLASSNHKTNLHLHYDMSSTQSGVTSNARRTQNDLPCKQSFFHADPSTIFQPKDPLVHKKLSMERALNKKLRWVTLGGQYNWTAKNYPPECSPAFPPDIAGVLKSLFPMVDPQAAILNFYSPQDILSVHRDVSEECDHGLISLSFGCDAIFVVGIEDGSETATIRLRSGDALLMSNPSRFAWHGVPKVLAGTCPEWLANWPMLGAEGSSYEHWKGWMAGKRINLNVRQMSENMTTGQGPPNSFD